jgi:hypothetical protein
MLIFLKHQATLTEEQDALVRREIGAIMQRLEAARHEARDLPDGSGVEVAWKVKSGRKGRPKQQIDPQWLSQMSTLRNKEGLAPVLGCSARTLRRRALEYKLVTPGMPVSRRVEFPDGGYQTVFDGNRTHIVPLTNEQVDTIVASHLEMFPNFGRSMMAGSLRVEGHNIPRQRVRESYDRLQGGPTARFGQRRIHRRAYQVAGPNSLWHHDGQHGQCAHHRMTSHLMHLRVDTLQACHTRLRGWILKICSRHSSCQQQQSTNCRQFISSST